MADGQIILDADDNGNFGLASPSKVAAAKRYWALWKLLGDDPRFDQVIDIIVEAFAALSRIDRIAFEANANPFGIGQFIRRRRSRAGLSLAALAASSASPSATLISSSAGVCRDRSHQSCSAQ